MHRVCRRKGERNFRSRRRKQLFRLRRRPSSSRRIDRMHRLRRWHLGHCTSRELYGLLCGLLLG